MLCSGWGNTSWKTGPTIRCSTGRSRCAISNTADSEGMTCALTCSDTSASALLTTTSMKADSGDLLEEIIAEIWSMDCGRSPRRFISAARPLELMIDSSARVRTSLSFGLAPDSTMIDRVVLNTGGLVAASTPPTAAVSRDATTMITTWLRVKRTDRRISWAGWGSPGIASTGASARIGVIRPLSPPAPTRPCRACPSSRARPARARGRPRSAGFEVYRRRRAFRKGALPGDQGEDARGRRSAFGSRTSRAPSVDADMGSLVKKRRKRMRKKKHKKLLRRTRHQRRARGK